jgi:hypothetical protein
MRSVPEGVSMNFGCNGTYFLCESLKISHLHMMRLGNQQEIAMAF